MSFKRKLVVYFVMLTLLPLAAAFLTFQPAVERGETAVVDARLQAALRAATAAYRDVLAERRADALRLAGTSVFQHALERRDRAAVERALARSPGVRVVAGSFTAGSRPERAAAGPRVAVLRGTRRLGEVITYVSLDARLARRLTSRSGLEPREHVLVLRRGRVLAGPPRFRDESVGVQGGAAGNVTTAGGRYRVAVAAGSPSVAAIAPQAPIDGAVDAAERRLLAAFAFSLLLVGIVAYLEGRSIVRVVRELVAAARAIAGGRLNRRVTVRGRDELSQLGRAFNEMAEQLESRLEELDAERRRVREATVRFAQALSATHDLDALRGAIVEAAGEATSASGGAFVDGTREVARWGELDGADRIELPVAVRRQSFGTLILWGPGFAADDIESAALLVGHAAVAFENARLHGVVEQQALVDALTGIANRRRAEEALAAELARAERYGSPLALVLADLDDFKAVNDGHGHESGDEVLRAFADILRAEVREVDLPARWGGEEFVLVLPGTDAEGAVVVAERVRREFASRLVPLPSGSAVTITASFGVAAYPPATSREALVAAADAALYDAKRAGKNRVAAGAPASAVHTGD